MMNWKGFGRKWSQPNFKVLSQHLPEGVEGEKSQDSRSPGQDLKVEPLEYDAGVLTT
jgi:hypothetical protein